MARAPLNRALGGHFRQDHPKPNTLEEVSAPLCGKGFGAKALGLSKFRDPVVSSAVGAPQWTRIANYLKFLLLVFSTPNMPVRSSR